MSNFVRMSGKSVIRALSIYASTIHDPSHRMNKYRSQSQLVVRSPPFRRETLGCSQIVLAVVDFLRRETSQPHVDEQPRSDLDLLS